MKTPSDQTSMNSVVDNSLLIAPVFDAQHFERVAERFKLLGDASRLRIISAICQQERSVTEICDRTHLNQPNVSKHLKTLKQAGVVACRRVGLCRYYRVTDKDFCSTCIKSLLLSL
ncbi:transcriptional regulator, ArsR family protein [Synechococcus sp. PCC 7335]|nr:transcriptional regulator, ArsR family protein [Synechococcus sp. PCC 7335]